MPREQRRKPPRDRQSDDGGRSICPGEPEGDAGPLALEPVARVLAYGKTWRGQRPALHVGRDRAYLPEQERSRLFPEPRELASFLALSRGGGSCHRDPCGRGLGLASAWRRWRRSPRRARSAARARERREQLRAKPTLAVVVVGERPRHEHPGGYLVPREVLRDVRGGLARAPHADAEERLSVSPLGWRLHRRPRMQSAGLGPDRRRRAVRRVDGSADTPPDVCRRAGRLLGSELAERQRRRVLGPGRRRERAQLLASESQPRLRRVAAASAITSRIQKTASGPTARSPRRARRTASSTGSGQSSPTRSGGASRGSPRPGRPRRPVCFAQNIAYADTGRSSARRTTRPGRRLEARRRPPAPSRRARTRARTPERQRRHALRPGRRRESAELHDPESQPRLPSTAVVAARRSNPWIEQVTIRPDRSFTATASQDGVSSGAKAKFTYVVIGNFEGYNGAGAPIAAGVYREDIVYADTAPARARRTTRPGQRLELDRGPHAATNRKGR